MKRPLSDFILALRCSTEATPKARRWALQNLVRMVGLSWISEEKIGLKPADVDVLMQSIIQKIRMAHGPKSISLATALWIQGSARARLASSAMVPRAKYLFCDALEIFADLGRWEDVVHISIEMAWWCIQGNDIAGAIEIIRPLLTPEWAPRYSRLWRTALENLLVSCSLKAAADAIQTTRGIKVKLPDPEGEIVSTSRWESDVGW